jgi:hypothetical protein
MLTLFVALPDVVILGQRNWLNRLRTEIASVGKQPRVPAGRRSQVAGRGTRRRKPWMSLVVIGTR